VRRPNYSIGYLHGRPKKGPGRAGAQREGRPGVAAVCLYGRRSPADAPGIRRRRRRV